MITGEPRNNIERVKVECESAEVLLCHVEADYIMGYGELAKMLEG